MITQRTCDGCTFCCWNFGIDNVPSSYGTLAYKPPLVSCHHLCKVGCDIHSDKSYPSQCRQFQCPYLLNDDIHRPDTFTQLLKEMAGNAEGYIPYIPTLVPVDDALALIIDSRTILAAVVVDNRWKRMVVPLDKDSEGKWRSTLAKDIIPWLQLCYAHGVVFTMESYV
jgi:hypothetical protein